ncbi:hypothetical protein I6I99_14810 [Sphingobacterium multivorum]|uniref:Fibronectin type-III domain-containing protein n=1 Tax=Sphingobacterium multivorum TaxID=28454 RepID=A0ABX7CVA1_SPHMU|nr:hypothetical protein [Sphingobacterium multivorum]QQT28633.1 hypothetical protein I6I99_14810 [Sphingobacterium multivorum]QQT55298.1 hypothetical protein I6I98_08610 [Sphingobacterium multivorum]
MKNPILHALRCCALLSFLFSFTSYSQNSKPSASKQRLGNGEISQKQADIYVAGACYSENTGRHTAVYWKNGQPVALTDGQTDAEAVSMAVVGNDVYVAGNIGGQAVYWKNGQLTRFSKDEGDYNFASSIAVINGSVYVTGYYRDYGYSTSYKDLAMYWKNGQPVALPVSMEYNSSTGQSGPAFYTSANYIAAIDDDIYIIGNNQSGRVYWKNGEIVKTINELKDIYAIAQLNGNAYAVGKIQSGQPAYWKNGHTESLSSLDGFATCIAVSGSDIYVAGVDDSNGSGYTDDGDAGKCWKNGQLFSNLKGTDFFIYRPLSMVVSGNDVYIVGNAKWGSSTSGRKLLKNGQILALTGIEGSKWAVPNFVTSKEGSEKKISKQDKVKPEDDNADVPQIIEPKNYTVMDQFPRTTKIAWTPVANATEYEVIVEYAAMSTNGERSFKDAVKFYPYLSGKTKAKAVTFDGIGAQVHRYKIQAINKDKIISATDWFYINYLH